MLSRYERLLLYFQRDFRFAIGISNRFVAIAHVKFAFTSSGRVNVTSVLAIDCPLYQRRCC